MADYRLYPDMIVPKAEAKPLRQSIPLRCSPGRVKDQVMNLLEERAKEGQIGVYLVDEFVGYAILYPESRAYFEDAPTEVSP